MPARKDAVLITDPFVGLVRRMKGDTVLAAQPSGGQVGRQHPVPDVQVEFQGGAVFAIDQTGVVIDDVYAAEFRPDIFIGRLNLVFVGHVGL